MADNVFLRGHVKYVIDVLASSDIFLFPSYGEGMANAFIEALHFGLPCIAYNNTVFPEFVGMGFHVTLAADRDKQDLGVKLLSVVEGIDMEWKASSNNVDLARKYFNVERELTEWQKILV